jgi:hypothetical protein
VRTILPACGPLEIWPLRKAPLINRSATDHFRTSEPFIRNPNFYSPAQFRNDLALVGPQSIEQWIEPFPVWNANTVRQRAEMLTFIAQEAWGVSDALDQSDPPQTGAERERRRPDRCRKRRILGRRLAALPRALRGSLAKRRCGWQAGDRQVLSVRTGHSSWLITCCEDISEITSHV